MRKINSSSDYHAFYLQVANGHEQRAADGRDKLNSVHQGSTALTLCDCRARSPLSPYLAYASLVATDALCRAALSLSA